MTTALYDSLDSLAQGIEDMGGLSPEYYQKMMHKIPEVACVERVPWLLNRLTDKTIVHVGCHGPLHEALLKTCKKAYGLDHEAASYPDFTQMDLESDELPRYGDVEVVLLAEVIEHLMSPGVLLWQVKEKYPGCEVIVTVPNAFSSSGYAWNQRGTEQVNLDHCCWYSWRTLTTLMEKCGYSVEEWYWAGKPKYTSEGIIFVVRAIQNNGICLLSKPHI